MEPIRYDYYKDRGIEREAFKSIELIFSENSSKNKPSYSIDAVEKGLIVKELIQHENPQGMQGFALIYEKINLKMKREKHYQMHLISNGQIRICFLMLIKEQIVLKIQN